VPAILTTLFCCLPLGVVSIVYASKVDSAWNAGDVTGANDAASKAKIFWMVSAGIGVVGIILYVIFAVVAVGASGF
jgi:hypothetical protein